LELLGPRGADKTTFACALFGRLREHGLIVEPVITPSSDPGSDGGEFSVCQPYDPAKAEAYWSNRLHQTDQMAAVLSFGLPDYLNQAYSEWELRTLIRALPPLKGLRVLDLACGVGRATVPLANEGAIVAALDNSAEMLEACRSNVGKANLLDQVTFQKGSADDLPFPDESFDVVICIGLLEHLPPLVRQSTLQQIVRVITRPGWVALIVNNEQSKFLTHESRYQMQMQQENGYFVGLIGRSNIESYFSQHGFALKVCGSNLFQSLVKQLKLKMNIEPKDSAELMTDLARLSMRLDLAYPNKGDLDIAFADQWMVIAKRIWGQVSGRD
jgi:ubiquinone/menaquinone biosynthesis C-methylase UbiE